MNENEQHNGFIARLSDCIKEERHIHIFYL